MTTQIKDRVKKQKEISESFISERGDEQEGDHMTINIEQINQQIDINTSHNDVSIILPQRPKSGNMLSRGGRQRGLLSQGNYNTVNDETQPHHEQPSILLSPTGFKELNFPPDEQEEQQ